MLTHTEERRRSLPALFGICAAIVASWAVVATFIASNSFYDASAFGSPLPWSDVLRFQLSAAAVWAVFTPVIVAVAERLSFRREHLLRNLLVLLAFIPLLAVVRAVAGAMVLDVTEGCFPTLSMMRKSIAVRLHDNMFIIAMITGITKIVDIHRDIGQNERRALTLQAAVADAEAERLRVQTQPSFLFRTLDAIRARVRSNPAAADQMLVRLGKLLRRSVGPAAGDTVTLEEELDLADQYLALQGMHSDAPMQVVMDVEEDVLQAAIPPFSLQTLLELAMGSEQVSSVVIVGRGRGDVLTLEAHATPGDVPAAGLVSARARLRQCFGTGCNGDVYRAGTTTTACVELRLPTATDERP